MAVRDSCCNPTVAARATNTKRTGNDKKFLASILCSKSSEVIFHIGPRSLIVVGSLWNHVRHQIRFLVDRYTTGFIPVGVWCHVSAVKTGERKIKIGYTVLI